jgi:hypothetical protein
VAQAKRADLISRRSYEKPCQARAERQQENEAGREGGKDLHGLDGSFREAGLGFWALAGVISSLSRKTGNPQPDWRDIERMGAYAHTKRPAERESARPR